ncbi:MAG TPA: hypothetical protein ENG40_01185 [Thermoprotei archaeon]|nr:hypothetical protein [Thermoprotei archaeon]
MVKFKPILKKPGDIIRAEDWNKIQEDIRDEIIRLEKEIETLKRYLNMMTESTVIIDPKSSLGQSFDLDETLPGEHTNYGAKVVGHIFKQWTLGSGKTGIICRFGILDYIDILYYWAGAGNGDKETLKITFEYVDGTVSSIDRIFIHEFTELRPKGTANPYVEYLLSPTEHVWYKYMLRNPHPEKEVRYIIFEDINPEATPRIGNVIQYLSRIRQIPL